MVMSPAAEPSGGPCYKAAAIGQSLIDGQEVRKVKLSSQQHIKNIGCQSLIIMYKVRSLELQKPMSLIYQNKTLHIFKNGVHLKC